MNVLSLFDGMSCGQLALERAGINVDNYFASEVDKYAISITQKNYPKTIQLGTITNWKNWNLPKIDLIIAGSPCQGFSIAGNLLNFEDPRSKLFFVFCQILKYHKSLNCDIKFLLENVKMKQAWKDVISKELEVYPVLINSSLVSAQNRERLYWVNWEFPILQDKGILLKDVIQDDVDSKYFLSEKAIKYMDRKTGDGRNHWDFAHFSDTGNEKSACVTRNTYRGIPYNVLINRPYEQVASLYDNNGAAGRIYSTDKKAITLKGEAGGMGGKMGLYAFGNSVRKLTPVECERLQTVPDNYTQGVSDTQRYKMLGNGWTVDVIAHIFSFLKDKK